MSDLYSKALFGDVSVGTIVKDKPEMIEISANTSIKDTLQILKSNKILSAPISKRISSSINNSHSHSEVVGIIDITQILTYVAFKSYKVGSESSPTSADDFISKTNLDVPVESILGTSEESQTVWRYETSESLPRIIEHFSKGVHRAIVHSNERPGPSKLVTQTDVAVFALNNLLRIPEDLRSSSLEKLDMVQPKQRNVRGVSTAGTLVTCSASETLLTCLRRMALEEVTALPVVDDSTGKLLATISSSDLRGLTADSLGENIFKPVIEVVPRRVPQIVAYKHSWFSDVLKLLVDNRIHRVWIVDNDEIPIGVVSLTDIMSKLSPYS